MRIQRMQVLAAVDLVKCVIIFVDSLAPRQVSEAGRQVTQALARLAEAFMRNHHDLAVCSAALLRSIRLRN
jgi:hypothetical protein